MHSSSINTLLLGCSSPLRCSISWSHWWGSVFVLLCSRKIKLFFLKVSSFIQVIWVSTCMRWLLSSICYSFAEVVVFKRLGRGFIHLVIYSSCHCLIRRQRRSILAFLFLFFSLAHLRSLHLSWLRHFVIMLFNLFTFLKRVFKVWRSVRKSRIQLFFLNFFRGLKSGHFSFSLQGFKLSVIINFEIFFLQLSFKLILFQK